MLCPQCGKEVGDNLALCANCQEAADAANAAQQQGSRARASTSSMRVPVTEEEFDSGDYAGFWIRFAAYLIDITIIGIPTLAIKVVLLGTVFRSVTEKMARGIGTAGSKDALAVMMVGSLLQLLIGAGLMLVLILVASWLYYALFESSPRRATPGKILCGLAVTDVDGNRVSFLRATGRHLCKAGSWIVFGLGYLFMLVSLRRQTFHDLVSNCVVVRTNYPPVARTWGLAIGALILGLVAQYFVEEPFDKKFAIHGKNLDAQFAQADKQMEWMERSQSSTAGSVTFPPSGTIRQETPPEPVNEKERWVNFPATSSEAHAVIGVNGHITTARTVLALAYPAGNSIAIGFFPEVLQASEITTLVRRGSLTSTVNEKHALLVINIQLRSLAGKLSDTDVLGYTATFYKDSTGGMLNTAYRAVSVSRSKEKFDANETVKLSGEAIEGKKIGFTLSVENITSAQGPNDFRWDALGDAPLYRMPG